MKKLVDETKRIANGFGKIFDKRDRMLDLVEEVGELAQAMLIVDGRKVTSDPDKKRTVVDVADALADILFDLIMLADDYGIELEEEYVGMLDRLEKRIKRGEFKEVK